MPSSVRNDSVPIMPGRIPCSAATCRISRTPHQPTVNTSIAGEGVAATIATLLKSGSPPEDFGRILQRLRRPGTQEREFSLPECQPRPEPARSQSAAVVPAANAVPPAEPFPPLRWRIQRGAHQPGAALTDRAVPGPCPRRSGRSARITRPAQPSVPQRSNSALTSERAQSTGMPIPKIAAPARVAERSQRPGSAVG